MLILADNDVTGAVEVLRYTLESGEWAEYAALLGLRFLRFADLALPRNATDRALWQACQAVDAVLITANRAGGTDSLEVTLDELAGPGTLPVITLADPQRILRDPAYAAASALRLLDYLDRMPSLRGTVRLFVP